MLKFYVKASDLLERLRRDQDGVVSFEYIIVAVCIVTVVGLVFGGGAGGESVHRTTGNSVAFPRSARVGIGTRYNARDAG